MKIPLIILFCLLGLIIMAHDHESVEYGLSEVKELYDACVLTGTIVEVDYDNDKADVNINGLGRIDDVPIFYHCEKSDTVAGGATAFFADDSVYVLNKKGGMNPITSDLQIIGFVDKLKHCCLAAESFITTNLEYTWLSYVSPSFITDNSSFSDDKLIFSTTFKSEDLIQKNASCERYAKGFSGNISTDPYLIFYNLPGWTFNGTADVQTITFFVIIQSPTHWLQYSTDISKSSHPAGLSEGIYYADIFARFRAQGIATDNLILRAYGFMASYSDRWVAITSTIIHVDKYDICPSIPNGAIQLTNNELVFSIGTPNKYQ